MPVTIEIGQIWQVRPDQYGPHQVYSWQVRIVAIDAGGVTVECLIPGTGDPHSQVGETGYWSTEYLHRVCECLAAGRPIVIRPSPNYIGSFLKTAI